MSFSLFEKGCSMTNYKRFISYLYYYEVGQRRGNIGFARVETSDELCKVTVHCAPKGIPQKSWKVILLRRKASQVIGEEVSTAESREGLLDVKLSYEQGMIKPNDFDFKDCIGIALMYSKSYYIGAKWDESSITYHEAELIEQAIREAHDKPKCSETINDISDELLMKQPEPIKEQNSEEKAKTTIYIVPSDEVTVVDLESKEPTESKEKEVLSEVAEEKSKEEDIVKVAKEIDEVEESGESEELKESEDMIKAAGGSAAAAVNMNQWIDHPAARAILNRFVRMYPFDDGEIAECVRLEPRDIGLLPMTSWPLGNNSFLLHSYCNFRHLLFAKKLTREGCHYFLMVPGTLNSRERQLAKMFGFENFKCSRRRCMRDGEFGYWYVEIPFN